MMKIIKGKEKDIKRQLEFLGYIIRKVGLANFILSGLNKGIRTMKAVYIISNERCRNV